MKLLFRVIFSSFRCIISFSQPLCKEETCAFCCTLPIDDFGPSLALCPMHCTKTCWFAMNKYIMGALSSSSARESDGSTNGRGDSSDSDVHLPCFLLLRSPFLLLPFSAVWFPGFFFWLLLVLFGDGTDAFGWHFHALLAYQFRCLMLSSGPGPLEVCNSSPRTCSKYLFSRLSPSDSSR